MKIPGETLGPHLHDVGVVQAVPDGDLLLEGVQDGPLLLLAAALRDVEQLHRHLAPLVPPAVDAPKGTRSNLDKNILCGVMIRPLWLWLGEMLVASRPRRTPDYIFYSKSQRNQTRTGDKSSRKRKWRIAKNVYKRYMLPPPLRQWTLLAMLHSRF